MSEQKRRAAIIEGILSIYRGREEANIILKDICDNLRQNPLLADMTDLELMTVNSKEGIIAPSSKKAFLTDHGKRLLKQMSK